MGDINLKLDADQYALVSGVLKADDAVKQLIKNTTKLGTAGKRSGKQLNDGFKGFMKTAASIAGGLGIAGGISKMTQAITDQFKRQISHMQQAQGRAAFTQLSVDRMQKLTVWNKPANVKTKQIVNLVQRLSDKYKTKQAEIWPSMGQMLSGKGDLSWARFADAAEQAVRLYKHTGIDIGTTAAGAMGVQRISRKATAGQSIGFIRGAGQQMLIDQPEQQVAAITPVISSAATYRWTPRQAVGMLGYLTMASFDTTGKKGMTGAINIMTQLDKARTKAGGLIPTRVVGPGGKFKTEWGTLKETGEAALTELQNKYATWTEAQRTEFRGKFQGEGRTKGALLNLIARKPGAVTAYESAKAGIVGPSDPAAAKPFNRYFREVADLKYTAVTEIDQLWGHAVEKIKLVNPYAASGIIRNRLKETLAELPGGADISTQVAKAMLEVKAGFGESHKMPRAALETLRGVRASQRWGEETIYTPGAGYGGGGTYENPNYRPAADKIVLQLMEEMTRMITILENKQRQPQKVEITNGGAPSPRAFGE